MEHFQRFACLRAGVGILIVAIVFCLRFVAVAIVYACAFVVDWSHQPLFSYVL